MSGPHHKNMGKRDLRILLTVVRSDIGHVSGLPTGVCAQFNRRVSSPISPPPCKKGNSDLVFADKILLVITMYGNFHDKGKKECDQRLICTKYTLSKQEKECRLLAFFSSWNRNGK